MKPQRNQTNSFLMLLLLRLQSGQNRSSGGYTLVITIAVLLVLSVLLITYAISSKVDNVSSTASAKSNTGFYNAEAGLNRRAEAIRAKFIGYGLPNGTPPTDPSGQTNWKACVKPQPGGNLGTVDFQCETDANIGVQPVSTYVEDLTQKVPVSIVIPEGELFSGLSAQEYRYNVISIAQDKQMQPTAILGMQFKSRLIPLFQFAAFYDQDMDVQLPPTMTLNGPVHSNNDMYLDASSVGPATLTIEGQVTAAGSLYRGEKQDSTCSGRVDIYDPTNAKDLPCSGSRQVFPTSALKAWNNRIRVGVQPLRLPDAGEFNAASGGRYWDAADLRIALDLTTTPPSVQVRTQGDTADVSGTNALNDSTCAVTQTTVVAAANVGDTTLTVNNASGLSAGDIITVAPSSSPSRIGAGGNSYVIANSYVSGNSIPITQPLSALVPLSTPLFKPIVSFSDKTFKNYREKRGNIGPSFNTPIQMLNVDIRGLLGCASSLMGGKALDDDTEGGLVWFLTVKGSASNTMPNDYGVRIYNGQDLASPVAGVSIKGLSVVSDQAAYILGDYNCGSSTTCNNGNDDDDIRKPAAVMADTINVLSNNWTLDDLHSNNDISSSFAGVTSAGRPTLPTTINAGFLAGIDITGDVNRGGQNQGYSTAGGGLNNYPRFHEDWNYNAATSSFSNVNFTYQGSMVSLGAPRKVNGRWCGSGSLADCNIYNPPNRLWRYDPLFNNAANLPPLTPRAVFLKQELFSRNFEQVARPMPELWAMLSPTHWLGAFTTLLQTHR
jgi:Tfp pilus assembly protein PilX